MSPVTRELRALRKNIDRWRDELRAVLETRETASRDGAVRRVVAAKMMGIGVTKLDTLVRAGKVSTAEDVRLIPLAEIRRYCAPKSKRQRKPAVGHRARNKHIDGQSDEALSELRTRLRAKSKAVGT